MASNEDADVSRLPALPREILIQFCKILNMKSLLELSQTCRRLYLICKDPEIIKVLLQRAFPLVDISMLSPNEYLTTYQRLYGQKKAEERAFQPHLLEAPRWEDPRGFELPGSFNPTGVPGILGGPDDLAPPDPFQPTPRWFPGGQHGHHEPFGDPFLDPFQPQPWHPGPLMGPRIRPRGPFPDPDRHIRPLRGPHRNPFGGGPNFPGFL